MTDHETFEAWWLEQTRQGDPARRLNLQRDAFIAGMQAARATAEESEPLPKDFASFHRQAHAWKDLMHSGEHDPWYVAMPNGALLKLGYHADDAVDKAHAEFIANAINTAMRKSQQDAAIESKPAESRISDAWISVKERLPDFDIPVAVAWDKAPWRTDGESAIDDMLHARNNDFDGWLWYTVSTGDLDEWDTEDMPTHWMALPAIESQRRGDGS